MENIKRFISTFISAIANCSLYSKEHVAVDELAQKALSILHELLSGSDSLEIMIVEDDLIVNKIPIRDIGLHGTNLVRRLKRKGLSRIDILKGVSFSELKQFISDITATDESQKTYPHIKTGVVDVRIGGPKIDVDFPMDSLSRLTSEQVGMVKKVYQGISPFKRLNIAGLEEIVVNFIVTFRREANILKLLCPVKSHSEYTYTHATDVAVLSMFQAETLNVRDELLHDIGIAALLHDVGKLFISKGILDKKSTLDKKEWEEIQLHTLYGARYLAKIDGLTHLAPIVALEHHLRYDGQGYPRLHVKGKKQHLCSQIVAISDFFDALRSRRPYRRELELKEVLSLMKKETEGVFNPFLVDNFVKNIHAALSE